MKAADLVFRLVVRTGLHFWFWFSEFRFIILLCVNFNKEMSEAHYFVVRHYLPNENAANVARGWLAAF